MKPTDMAEGDHNVVTWRGCDCGTIYRARHGSVTKLTLHLKVKRQSGCAAGVDLKSLVAGKCVCGVELLLLRCFH